MRSLRWKLVGALVLIVLLSVALMAFITDRNITSDFTQYICQCNTSYCEQVAHSLTPFYAQHQSWDGVQYVMTGLVTTEDSRFVLSNTQGTVIGDTESKWLGQNIHQLGLSEGTPIVVSGHEVGRLYAIDAAGASICSMPVIGAAEQEMLDRTHRSLLVTGIIAAAAACAVGLVLTRQMTNPIRALSAEARRIGLGDLSHRVKVNTHDEIGELADSFNSMTNRLEAGEQARRRLTADVAHELRTPLTIIEGTTNGMLDGVFAPDAEHLGIIKQQTTLLTHLISDLRDLSLAEAGQLKLERLATDLTGLLRHKIAEAEVAGREKGLHFSLNAPEEMDKIMVDPLRLGQVIANLLANAIRHTPAGGDITVSLSTVADDTSHGVSGPAAIISVTDNGEGISPEHLPHIFERFYRTQDSRSRSEGGTGLGLAIVKQMIQAHGGRVWAESTPGQGSTFYLSLPYSRG